MVKQLTERLQNAQAGVLADYRGLTVEQDTELRRKLREANVEYTVLKNSIIRFAAKEVGLEDLDSVLAVSYTHLFFLVPLNKLHIL